MDLKRLYEGAKRALANLVAACSDRYVRRERLEDAEKRHEEDISVMGQELASAHYQRADARQVAQARTLESIGDQRQIESLKGSVGWKDHENRRLRRAFRTAFDSLFEQKPFTRFAVAYADDRTHVYYQNQTSIKIAGRIRGKELGGLVDFSNLDKQEVEIGSKKFYCWVKPLPLHHGGEQTNHYLLILRPLNIFSRLSHYRATGKQPTTSELQHAAQVALAIAQADVTEREARAKAERAEG